MSHLFFPGRNNHVMIPGRPGPASQPFALTTTMPRPPLSALLIDLSGTLHIGAHPTPGALRALERLRAARVPFRFCSNTSQEGRRELGARLAGMGIEVRGRWGAERTDGAEGEEEEELWTSLGALGERVRELGVRRCAARRHPLPRPS